MRAGSHSSLQIVTLAWVVGMSTLFPLFNDALDAVSVLTLDRVVFLASAALFVVMMVRTPDMLRGVGRVEFIMAVYVITVLLSWFTTFAGKNAVDLKRDLNLLLNGFVMPYTAFVIGRHGRWSEPQTRGAILVLVFAVGTFLVFVGFVQGTIDWTFLVAEADQWTHRNRARGSFANAVTYAVVVSLLVPLALHAYQSARPRWLRFALITLAFCLLEMLIFARTRIVWIAVPLAVVYFAASSSRVRGIALATVATLALLVGLSVVGLDHRLIAQPGAAALQRYGKTTERLADAESTYNRVAVFSTALNMIAHRPLFGFGFGARTFQAEREPYYASCCGVSYTWAIPCDVPHNEILNVLILFGAAGLLVYAALLHALWQGLARSMRAENPVVADRATAVLAMFIVLATTAMLHDVMYMYPAQVLFFFVAGLAAQVTPSVVEART